ncbi:MAG: hypothetical protein UR30_C0005G0056 [Candidatus Peregrinibacteria bacterium GW2011_GWC2_33_13]|nr:MAG: hypothetical protein UR30_C0005G0056 [Candidatus Peregrinibacteria bacterium GW2011_GWC2_33_13]
MIKWITENLGTAAYLDAQETKNISIVDVRDLVDKSGNVDEPICSKINDVLSRLNNGEKVVICCDYGMSRSNSIAAGVLSKYNEIPFNQAIRNVMQITQESDIKIEVLSSVREALKDKTSKNLKDNKKRIFVTGSSGFLGTSLVPELLKQNIIFKPSSKELNLLENLAEIDLYVKENNITHILHLAYPRIANTQKSFGEALTIFKNVLDVCKENKIKLIYPSNCIVYSGYKSESLLASENLLLAPKGLYAETKYLCEILLKQYKQMYGLEFTIVRSSPVYGNLVDKPKFIYNFIDKALKNETIKTHKYLNGFPKVDLFYIDDFIKIISEIINQDYTGELNIGSGIGVSTNEIAQIIIDLLNSKSTIEHNEIEEYSSNIVMDTSKAGQLFNWKPEISVNDGLKRIIANKIKK